MWLLAQPVPWTNSQTFGKTESFMYQKYVNTSAVFKNTHFPLENKGSLSAMQWMLIPNVELAFLFVETTWRKKIHQATQLFIATIYAFQS